MAGGAWLGGGTPRMALVLAAILAALFVWVRPDLGSEGPHVPESPWLRFGSALVLVLASALLAARLSRSYYRRLLRQLARQTAALRENPSPNTLTRNLNDRDWTELAEAIAELEAFSASYRQALADIVQAGEAVERLRGSASRSGDSFDPTGSVSSRSSYGVAPQRMIARLAPNLHWMAATQPLQQLLGHSINHLVARSFLDVVHADDVAALRKALTESLKDGEGHNITFRILCPSRGERHLQMDVMAGYGEGGAPISLRCHLLDVTDRVLTERELHRRTEDLQEANARLHEINANLERLKESYRDLYNQAPVLYFSLDARDRFLACNDTLARALGYRREDLIGQPYVGLLTAEARAAFERDPEALQRPGELETQWVRQDGAVLDVLIDSTVVKDAAGQFLRSRSAARDVTERKRLANALHAQTVELTQANARLRQSNQELEEVTHVVSHDLKEPLRTLEAFSNFLATDYGPQLAGEGQDYIDHLIQASRRLGALIDDLLSLGRAGRVINTPRPFAVEDALRTVLADLRDLIQRRQARVRLEGPFPPVCGDPERVVQLLTNLIGNGLKYNKSPSPEVVVGWVSENGGREAQADPRSAFVTLFVRDNGLGIDPQYHQQIFRIFRRLHRREEYDGTGAGLAICKKIVEAHGGRIWVESAMGRGATFYVTLPRSPASASVPAQALVLDPQAAETRS
jgi:PAS domain S-box-containing protein